MVSGNRHVGARPSHGCAGRRDAYLPGSPKTTTKQMYQDHPVGVSWLDYPTLPIGLPDRAPLGWSRYEVFVNQKLLAALASLRTN